MDHAAQILTVRQASAGEILPYVERAERYGEPGESGCIVEAGQGFVIERDGRAIVGYVLQVVPGGVFITSAFGGERGLDLTAVGLSIIEQQAQGFESVGFKTIRRGLVRKVRKLGYYVHAQHDQAFIMRKKLT